MTPADGAVERGTPDGRPAYLSREGAESRPQAESAAGQSRVWPNGAAGSGAAEWEPDLFRLLVEHADEHAIFMVDIEGKVVIWNHGAERLFGYGSEEIVGRHFSCLYPAEDVAAEKPARDLEQARESGKAACEAWRVRKDGTRFLGEAVATPLRDSEGRLRGFCRVVRDVTGRRRTEQALEDSERRFRLFMDNSPTVNFVKDGDGRLLYVDETWKQTFRNRSSEWIGKTDAELWPPDVARRLHEADSAALASPDAVESLVTLPTARGEAKWLFLRFVFHESSGRLCLGGIGIDVTEEEQNKDRIRRLNVELERRVAERTAELTAANVELNAFCYSVSHDLRAPLRGIDGFSQALLEDYADRLDAEGVDYLHRVRAEAQRMGQLIDDLLSLSRVSRMELHRERTVLSEIAAEVAEDLRRRDPHRRVELVLLETPPAEADGRLIRVALENLFGNAWKFTSKQPRARIEFGFLHLPDDAIAWYVRDDGVGFDMAYAEHLFGAFQRLHGATEFPGAGIGLATVQRIVHRHGGRVWAESVPGRGSTFYFTLAPSAATNFPHEPDGQRKEAK